MPKKKFIKDKNGKFAGSIPDAPKSPVDTNTKPIPVNKLYEKENGSVGLAGKKFHAGLEAGATHSRNQILTFALEGIEKLSASLIDTSKNRTESEKAYLKGEIDALKAIVRICQDIKID
jgi:hypothetical protein